MAIKKINTITLQTPEGILFSFLLASPVTRCLAWVVDLSIISAVTIATGPFIGILGFISYDLALAIRILYFFCLSIGYGIFFEWSFKGQTLGKKILRLRVMDEKGLRLQFSQIVVRNLLRFVDSLPVLYLIGGLTSLISKKAQRLGDVAANTVVIRSPEISEPDLSHILSDKYNSLRDFPHLEARLRQNVSPDEAGIAIQALYRRDELDAVARIELFKEIADYFKSIVLFPQEATDGISDEQYIRNVIDVLFRNHIKTSQTNA